MDKTATARRLRRDQTLAERTLWTLVRNRRLGGVADDILAVLRSETA